MPDKTDPEPTETQTQEPEPDQEAFWTRFRDETTKVVDARLQDRDRKKADKRRSDSQRVTLPGIISDIMFGKQK
jgi:hypothetical protein